MVSLVIVALIIIGIAAILAFFAPQIKRWANEMRNKEVGKTPLFSCTPVSEKRDFDAPNSPDIYDCVEDKGKT